VSARRGSAAHLLSIPSRMHERVWAHRRGARLRASHTSPVYARTRPTGVLINSITLSAPSAPRPRTEVALIACEKEKEKWNRRINRHSLNRNQWNFTVLIIISISEICLSVIIRWYWLVKVLPSLNQNRWEAVNTH